jgi:hypothetical protein
MSCGNSRSSKCNPCGPSEAALNEIANKAAYYARIAKYSLDEFTRIYLGAKDTAPTTDNEGQTLQEGALYFNTVSNILFVWNGTSWTAIDDDEIYLGGFSVAPTLNNQGLPLQVGNLYWNTGSNNLWAYNGSTWIRTNFNETTPFLSTGSTTARTLANRFADVVNIEDFGAVGDWNGTTGTDNSAAIQAAINSGAKAIYGNPSKSYLCNTQINITNTDIFVSGGTYVFNSNNGFVYTSNNSSTRFQLKDITLVSNTLNIPAVSATAISAIWSGTISQNNQGCVFSNVRITGNGTKAWNVGINISNSPNNILDNISIVNSAGQLYTEYGIKIGGTSVTSIVSNSYMSNVDNGIVFLPGTYNVIVDSCHITYTNICIDFRYVIGGWGAILNVSKCLLYPFIYGIKSTAVIAMTIDKCFFQKEFNSNWTGIYVDQLGGGEIYESMITNCQFGDNPGFGFGSWTGINIVSGRVFSICENQFDSGVGTCIQITSTESIIKNNLNMQSNVFISGGEITNKISDNIDIQTIKTANAFGVDVGTFNPPNIKNYLGNAQNGYMELGNSGGAVNVDGIYGGCNWQIANVLFTAGNITLRHNTLSAGSSFFLKGGINYNPPSTTVMTFLAVPDGAGNINWREISRN